MVGIRCAVAVTLAFVVMVCAQVSPDSAATSAAPGSATAAVAPVSDSAQPTMAPPVSDSATAVTAPDSVASTAAPTVDSTQGLVSDSSGAKLVTADSSTVKTSQADTTAPSGRTRRDRASLITFVGLLAAMVALIVLRLI